MVVVAGSVEEEEDMEATEAGLVAPVTEVATAGEVIVEATEVGVIAAGLVVTVEAGAVSEAGTLTWSLPPCAHLLLIAPNPVSPPEGKVSATVVPVAASRLNPFRWTDPMARTGTVMA